MSISATVLFGTPQHEIASLLVSRLTACQSASLVAGFLTVEGAEAIADPFRNTPAKLANIVVGAGTYRAYAALDQLISIGVPVDRMHVHLGHTRATTSSKAQHKFLRYHPMLHSKVYYCEMPGGAACAFVGSHNLTGFALQGLNGEASVLLEGDRNDPQFVVVRQHIDASISQAVPYQPGMKEAYSWWTGQFLEGLRRKAKDEPTDGEVKRTIVILAEAVEGNSPRNGDKIYFEIPEALKLQSTNTDVHVYLFDRLPASPYDALYQLDHAFATLWCRIVGLEDDQGGAELDADWTMSDRRRPVLIRTSKPFRPRTTSSMQQVRIEVHNEVFGRFEYLFDKPGKAWVPELEKQETLAVDAPTAALLQRLELRNLEAPPWFRVVGLVSDEPAVSEGYRDALRETSPESGAFVLLSLRRRTRE